MYRSCYDIFRLVSALLDVLHTPAITLFILFICIKLMVLHEYHQLPGKVLFFIKLFVSYVDVSYIHSKVLDQEILPDRILGQGYKTLN